MTEPEPSAWAKAQALALLTASDEHTLRNGIMLALDAAWRAGAAATRKRDLQYLSAIPVLPDPGEER